MGKIALFIDGGYLDKIFEKHFHRRQINYQKLIVELCEGRNLLRAYYYHCLPYVGENPSKESVTRHRKTKNFWENQRLKIQKFEVRLGELAYRGFDSAKSKHIYVQKRVDIMIGMDIMRLTLKGAISEAVIVSGDSDFVPAIKAMKDSGIEVELRFHKDAVHAELLKICDTQKEIDNTFVDNVEYTKNQGRQ